MSVDEKTEHEQDCANIADEPSVEHDCWNVIKLGRGEDELTPVRWLYDTGYFKNDEQARGAFELAWLFAFSTGITHSDEEWMGMTNQELCDFLNTQKLPPRNLSRCGACGKIGKGKRIHTPCPLCGYDQRDRYPGTR